MAWIESHQTLDNHPKLIQACAGLKIGRPQMIGHLHLLWHWCLDYAIDGDLSKYTPQQIAKVCDWDHDPDTFVMVLTDANFLDRAQEAYKVHDWLDFCGDLVKKRLEYKAAKRRRRKHLGISQRKTENSQLTVPYHTIPNPTEPTTTKRVSFVKPTAAEVTAYGASIDFRIDGAAFCDFYESKGWKIGSSPMRSWQAAVRTWKRKAKEDGHGAASRPSIFDWNFKKGEQTRSHRPDSGLREAGSAAGQVLNRLGIVRVPEADREEEPLKPGGSSEPV